MWHLMGSAGCGAARLKSQSVNGPHATESAPSDYSGGISKCGDRRLRTLLYEAANVMLTRYKGPLKLKDWAFAIAKRSTMRKARIALPRRLAIIKHTNAGHGNETKTAVQSNNAPNRSKNEP